MSGVFSDDLELPKHLAPEVPVKPPIKISEKEKRAIEMSNAFRGIECPLCGYLRCTVLDIICPNCHGRIQASIIVGASEQKLTGGMTAGEAVRRAREWWNKNGREYFRRARNRGNDEVGKDEELSRNGILMGRHWEQLSRREQVEVVKKWYNAWYGEHVARLQGGTGAAYANPAIEADEGENGNESES